MPISIQDYLRRGPSTSKEIMAATGLSQPTVSRQIKALGENIIQIIEGRSKKYAATCNAFNSGDKIPLGMLNRQGHIDKIAYIRPLNYGGFFIEPIKSLSRLFFGATGNGLYDDLPYFLLDLRPQGFIGRQIARILATKSDDFPSDPRNWNSNHIGRYLISNGEDLPGNFIFGDQAFLRIQGKAEVMTQKDYPNLANRAIKGETPGSSAGGEQPKFSVFNGDLSSHVLVKFSPPKGNAVAARWRDILITEYHAARIINKKICPAAESRLIEIKERFFLETKRFDRHGEHGRSSMVSLQAIDAEFTGQGSNWHKVMKALYTRHLITEQDFRNAESLWLFGILINNTDMHLGNLSLKIKNDSFELLPLYDMCSMGFAPKSSGEIPLFSFELPDNEKIDIARDRFAFVKDTAREFWENVANDNRISEQFKKYLDQGNPVDRQDFPTRKSQ